METSSGAVSKLAHKYAKKSVSTVRASPQLAARNQATLITSLLKRWDRVECTCSTPCYRDRSVRLSISPDMSRQHGLRESYWFKNSWMTLKEWRVQSCKPCWVTRPTCSWWDWLRCFRVRWVSTTSFVPSSNIFLFQCIALSRELWLCFSLLRNPGPTVAFLSHFISTFYATSYIQCSCLVVLIPSMCACVMWMNILCDTLSVSGFRSFHSSLLSFPIFVLLFMIL